MRLVKYLGLFAVLSLMLAVTPIAGHSRHAEAAGASISIVDFAFSPATMTIHVGDTVTWTNTGQQPHTSTSDTGLWDSGTLPPGASFSHTFTAAGTFAYHCKIHPFMTAMIIVQPAAAVAPAAVAATAQAAPQAPAAQATAAAPAAVQPVAQATAPASTVATAATAQAGAAATTAQATPQLPNTGSGGLLSQQKNTMTDWALLVFLFAVLSGGAALAGRFAWNLRNRR